MARSCWTLFRSQKTISIGEVKIHSSSCQSLHMDVASHNGLMAHVLHGCLLNWHAKAMNHQLEASWITFTFVGTSSHATPTYVSGYKTLPMSARFTLS